MSEYRDMYNRVSASCESAAAPVSAGRRRMMAASLAVPAAAWLGQSRMVRADTSTASMAPNAIKNTFELGEFEVSTLLAGTRTVEDPQSIFGMNVSAEDFSSVSQQNFIPADKTQFFFTPTVVRSGSETVLFDTGLDAGGIKQALGAAGIAPEEVSVVVLTHMHGDHIGGLTDETGTPTFANARYVTGQVEFDAWAKMDNEGFNNKVKPLAEKMQFIGDGDSVVSGITGMGAFGHTPGHMVYLLESGSEQLLLAADSANHYVWSLAYPEWEVKFDMDKAKAAETRKQVFGMLASDQIPFVGYHMPFPGIGYVETRGEGGFRYVAASYQMML